MVKVEIDYPGKIITVGIEEKESKQVISVKERPRDPRELEAALVDPENPFLSDDIRVIGRSGGVSFTIGKNSGKVEDHE